MELLNNNESVDICSSLFLHLSSKGLGSSEVNQLVKDVFTILKDGGIFTIGSINSELETKGWGGQPIDDHIVELMLALLEKEFKYTVSSHTIH